MHNSITLGGAEGQNIELLLSMSNRHGLIAGATGTGKTVTLQVLAEAYSRAGVPVFLADIKGDLSGLGAAGKPHPKIDQRLKAMHLDNYQNQASPATFWDILAEQGIPVRLSVSDLGAPLLSQLLGLNETQSAILTMVFDYADQEDLLLLDLNDLKTSLAFLREHSSAVTQHYGRISGASVSAIMRKILLIEGEGLAHFFGEPALEFNDLMRLDKHGKGVINILAADKLMRSPKTYSVFLLWLLSELFENLPEIGDPEKPTMVLFFDEAHLMFKDAPKLLVDRIEQVVRLIRSKGVGVYFISQNPTDIPDAVLGQLGNRIQHALRAFSAKDAKAIRQAAATYRQNPKFKIEDLITQLGVGEALVSTLNADGIPSMVEKTMLAPPQSQIGPLNATERTRLRNKDKLASKYQNTVDPESAHELLQTRMKIMADQALEEQQEAEREKREKSRTPRKRRNQKSIGDVLLKSVIRGLGSRAGQRLIRGVLGSLIK